MHCGLFGNASFFYSLLKFRIWFKYSIKFSQVSIYHNLISTNRHYSTFYRSDNYDFIIL